MKLFKRKNKTTLTAVGDIMLSRKIEELAELYPTNWLFGDVAGKMKGDIVFANLESVISDKGAEQGSKYSFRANPKMLEVLKTTPINLLSVVNNHSYDWGKEAWSDSNHRLQDKGYNIIGEEYNPFIFSKNGLKIAFFAYNLVKSQYKSKPIIQDLKKVKNVDYKVVSLHWGREYKGVSDRQRKLAYELVENGVDVILGHHPHRVQEIEERNGAVIFYSLGNFLFDQWWGKKTQKGMIVKIILNKNQPIIYKIHKTNTFNKKIELDKR